MGINLNNEIRSRFYWNDVFFSLIRVKSENPSCSERERTIDKMVLIHKNVWQSLVMMMDEKISNGSSKIVKFLNILQDYQKDAS
jgi:hypothetical protein